MMRKILIISDCPSDPPTAGNRNCIKQNANMLIENGYEVFFLLVNNRDLTNEEIKQMKKIWGSKLYIYTTNVLQKILQKILAKLAITTKSNFLNLDIFCPWGITNYVNKITKENSIDAIIVNYIWLSKILQRADVGCKAIYTHDVFSYKNQKGSSIWFSFDSNTEAKALRRANHILAIQENEAVYYSYLAPLVDVRTVYMPFEFHQIPVCNESRNILFFSGCNEHNINGITTFIKDIFPSLKNEWSDIKLLIGGSICQKMRDVVEDSFIELMGEYDDPADFYSLGNIVINPVYEGTGLKVKTFEAISYGKFVLAHRHSLEGIFDRSNVPIKECVTSIEYIDAISSLWNGEIKAEYISISCDCYLKKLNQYILDSYNDMLK